MRHIHSFPGLILVLLILGGCTLSNPPPADDEGTVVQIQPIEVPRTRMAPEPIPAVFMLPAGKGKGPFPAVIVLHGCGGRGPSQITWARRLNGWGYAALIPDSMTPRGVTSVCAPDRQALVTPRDRVADVGAAVAWLRTRPEIDPNRIAVLGDSHGGATAAMAAKRIYDSLGLRAAIDYYGRCDEPAAQGKTPLLALAGELDDWGDPAAACELYGKDLRPGQIFEVHTYPETYHAFDNPALTHAVNNGHILEFNVVAAEDSFDRVHAFLDRWVRH
jgi:dienelactone hydrolase